MKVKLIFPAREVEFTAAIIPAMPLGISVLTGLTPDDIELKLVYMTQGAEVGYEEGDDTVVVGEAEELWPKLLEDFQQNKLNKFYVCGPFPTDSLTGEFYHIKERPALSNLPQARRDLLPRERYWMDTIYTTRGCPNRCRFCPVFWLFGGRIRHRPISEVVVDP